MSWFLANSEVVIDPILPGPLIGLIGAALAVATWWYYRTLGEQLSRARNVTLMFFRLAGMAVILLLLLQPSRKEQIPPPVTKRVTLVAMDSSRSMKQQDAGRVTRLDAARNLLLDSGITARDGLPADSRTRLLEFSEDARPVTGSILDLTAKGATTRFHKSVTSALGTLAGGETAAALILLSDGHDFELLNPSRTGFAARNRGTPIYAVALGKQGKVRDVSVRMTSYQPYCYVKQQARVNAALRLVGCELESPGVQLLRNGAVVQTKRVDAGEQQEIPVEFEVVEPEVGQYEYEVRAVPLEHELDTANNSAITYLNVIDQQIQVLILEGSPYWDTTFLQRSLMRNDKFEVDAYFRYANKKTRAIRKRENAAPLQLPQTLDEFGRYDVLVLGRAVDQLLSPAQLGLLVDYVRHRGGTIIFSRGRAFDQTPPGGDELQPVEWGKASKNKVRLQAARESQATAPFRSLAGEAGGLEGLPELLAVLQSGERKPLTATLATAGDPSDPAPLPCMVHRRFGAGQMVSLGLEGLWRWGFHPKVEGANTAFDRFWDQMMLWLLAGRDFIPTRQFSFRPNSANIQLGEKVYFRLMIRTPDPSVRSVPLRIYLGDREAGRAMFTPTPGDPTRLVADFLPERTGRYRAVADFPDRTTQESRFIVFTENLEETEVATDVTYLKRLCESSGGRLLLPEELGKLNTELRAEKLDLTPKTKLTTLWDQATVFYMIGLLLGIDWYLRRRWGLS